MPALGMAGNFVQAEGGNMIHLNQSLKQNTISPRSPLSHGIPDTDSIDLAIDGAADHHDALMQQLYRNICDMESSEYSPSMRSFTTYGNESRLDLELRHLVGADLVDEETAEVLKEVLMEHKANKEEGNKSTGSNEDSANRVMLKPGLKTIKNRLGIARSSSASAKVKAANMEKCSSPAVSKTGTKCKPPLGLGKKAAVPITNRSNSGSSLNGVAEDSSEAGADNPDLGPYLLKKARSVMTSGDNPRKAFELALRAKKSFEKCADGKPNLNYLMCLHILASIYCSLRQYDKAIPLLEQSVKNSDEEEGQNHALAKFAGFMQLGDIHAMLGQIEKSIFLYKEGLEVQRRVLGDRDPRLAETCRYIAEAHVQAMQFDEAGQFCQMALDIHSNNGNPLLIEEAADRRLMGLICDSKGDHESALQHYILASTAMSGNGQETDMAAVDCSIGNAYLALARYDEAACSFKKALVSYKWSKGADHPAVASVYVSLADLHNKVGKFRESKSYCEDALKIYTKQPPGTTPEEISNGLIDLAVIYESMNEVERALELMEKALKVHSSNNQGHHQSTVAGIEAQIGVMCYMLGNYKESYNWLNSAVTKLRECGDTKSPLYGISLNQMGLACVQLFAISEATELFEEARMILEKEYGQCHPDTLGVYSNLAGTYDALGRWDEAIEILEHLVGMREEKLGTANPVVDDEKRRLAELLKEAGRGRNKKTRSLETLLERCPSLAINSSIGLM